MYVFLLLFCQVSEDKTLRTVCVAILVLCNKTREIQDLTKLINSVLPDHVVMNFLYAAAAVLWEAFLWFPVCQR